jgi:penicillin V acylase-like amidase (Ntn superfamily)
MLRYGIAVVAALATINAGYACTAVDIVAADKSVIAGRTMEWAFDMKWALVSQPKGTELELTAPSDLGLPAVKVATKYAVVGVSPGVIPGGALLEGQNSEGLGMSGNFLPGFTEYQAVTKDDKSYVSVLDFGSWALGNHASVAELRAALPGIKVWWNKSLPSGPTPPLLHFVFVDRSGDGMIVEYVDGALQVSDNKANVLTNAPTYDWHLLNLRNYLNLSSMGVSSREVSDVNVTALGQGGGTTGLPGDFTPPARFVRAAFMRHWITQPKDADEAIQAMDHILNTVDIPIGIAQTKENGEVVSDYTQFVAIKDLTRNRLLITDYAHRTTFLSMDLDAIFAQAKPSSVPISDLPYPTGFDGTSALKN